MPRTEHSGLTTQIALASLGPFQSLDQSSLRTTSTKALTLKSVLGQRRENKHRAQTSDLGNQQAMTSAATTTSTHAGLAMLLQSSIKVMEREDALQVLWDSRDVQSDA